MRRRKDYTIRLSSFLVVCRTTLLRFMPVPCCTTTIALPSLDPQRPRERKLLIPENYETTSKVKEVKHGTIYVNVPAWLPRNPPPRGPFSPGVSCTRPLLRARRSRDRLHAAPQQVHRPRARDPIACIQASTKKEETRRTSVVAGDTTHFRQPSGHQVSDDDCKYELRATVRCLNSPLPIASMSLAVLVYIYACYSSFECHASTVQDNGASIVCILLEMYGKGSKLTVMFYQHCSFQDRKLVHRIFWEE